jgi:CRISPR-associated protein Cst1
MLRYTGHPFVDVGVAVITAFYQKQRPSEVEDLAAVSQYMLDTYINPTMSNYLGTVVFANVGYANPGIVNDRKHDAARRTKLAALLELAKTPDADRAVALKLVSYPNPEDRCIFSGESAVARVSRTIIPMTMSEDAFYFLPEGLPLLPVAGWCIFALLAMPLGALNVGGKMLIVHSSEPSITLGFAKEHLVRNQQNLQIQGLEKLPNYQFARTQLIAGLVHSQHHVAKSADITAYHFTSTAQSADVEIYQLPSNLVSFVRSAIAHHKDAWSEVVARAYAQFEPGEEVKVKSQTGRRGPKQQIIYQERNFFYEDLFNLPHHASAFLRRYLLRVPARGKPKGDQKRDPRFTYSYRTERQAISWGLTELFLKRMMNMDKERIESIRKLGDGLALYIRHEDRRLFKQLFTARSDRHIILALLKAANNAKGVLLPFHDLISAFFIDEGETLKPDWYLARDLLMVRIIEQLHSDEENENWIEQNADLLDEADKALAESDNN